MNPKKSLDPGLWILLGALGFFHLWTIRTPSAQFDEAAMVDWAMRHGDLSWRAVYGPAFQHLTYLFGVGGLWNIFMALIRVDVAFLGASLSAVRAPTVLSALLSLGLFVYLLQQLAMARWITRLTLFLWGFSFLFMYVSHAVRPEPLILLVGLANILWVLCQGNAWWGVLLGLASGLSGAIHQTILFSILGLPVLEWAHPQPTRQRARYLGWAAGLLIGGFCAVHLIDWEAGARVVMIVKGHQIIVPPLIGMHANPWPILLFCIRLLNLPGIPHSAYWVFMVGSLMTSLVIMLTRWQALQPAERFVTILAVSQTLIITLVTGAADARYVNYVYPWLLLVLLMVIQKYWSKQFMPRYIDTTLLALALAASFAVNPHPYALPMIVGMVSLWIWFVTTTAYIPRIGLLASFVFLTVLCMQYMDSSVYVAILCKRGLFTSPVKSIFLASLPWVFLSKNKEGPGWRFPVFEKRAPFLGLFFSVILCCHTVSDFQVTRDQIKGSRFSSNLTHLLEPVGSAARLLAPATVALYVPTRAVYCLEALSYMPRRAQKESCLRLRPQYVLANSAFILDLRTLLAKDATLSLLRQDQTMFGPTQVVEITWNTLPRRVGR